MTGKIFNIQSSGDLVEMLESGFVNEDDFQVLLERYPDLLAGDQINSESPRRWLLITREMGIADHQSGSDRWSLDHLFIDQDGVPTLVEVKRSTDTRLRREVVGQVLDYAANAVVHWSLDKIQSEFERQCEKDKVDPEVRLSSFLGGDEDPLKDGDDDADFWQRVKTNLQAGKVRILIVADIIPPELRRIVEFLNEQMDPAEVLAVEIRQYVGEGIKTLVPRVIGQTAEAEARKQTRHKRKLTREQLQQIANANGVGDIYRILVSKCDNLFDSNYNSQSNIGFAGRRPDENKKVTMICLIPGESDSTRGLCYRIYVDRVASYVGRTREEILQVLPEPIEMSEYSEETDVASGYVRAVDEMAKLLDFLSNRN